MPIGLDPVASFSYHVDIKNVTIAQFQHVEGLSIQTAVIQHRENKLKALPVMKKLPGHVNFPDIHLSRGKVIDKAFWDWIKKVQDGDVDSARTEGSIVLWDYAHKSIAGTFNFYNGWPSSVSIGSLSAEGDSVLLESVTITHERLEVA